MLGEVNAESTVCSAVIGEDTAPADKSPEGVRTGEDLIRIKAGRIGWEGWHPRQAG
jgi:hypothetical protein